MGLRGPAPLPTAIHELRGNPGKRPLNRHEPRPERVAPRMPELVKADERAKKHWRRLVPLLLKMRVLTEADGAALGNLCLDMAVLEQAQTSLQKTGLLLRTPRSGMVHQNPLLAVISAASERVSRGLREFGMTPSSRSRIVVPPGEADSPWRKLRDEAVRIQLQREVKTS